mgnify:FL=1|tara:strand:+ start:54 stop:449 length:396 start_codon:yes stop_codon:yes gene_type:complete
MRNLYILLLTIFTLVSCDEDGVNLPATYYPVEGKWLWSPDPDDRSYANTMYEYVNGTIYTYYPDCWPDLCSNDHFNSLEESDRIPGTDFYEYDGYSLIIDGIQEIVTFECEGGIMLNENGGKLWRLNSDCQ